MNNYKANTASIYSLFDELNNSTLKPIYFFFGEDHYSINSMIKTLTKKIDPLITTDFDKETINVERKANISDLIDLAYTFPFGSEKKLLIVKNFENFNSKKQLTEYITNPSETTILIIAHYGDLPSLKSEPYKLLENKKYIYEAREIKGKDLENWVIKRCNQLGLKIQKDTLRTLIETVGEDKSLLEMQIQKFKTFLGEKEEITSEEIKNLAAKTKEYSIFDLLNSIGKGKAADSYKVINNLLEHGKDLVFILNMLAKYLSVVAQSIELKQRKFTDNDASKAIGVSRFYYQNCKNALYFNDDKKLRIASKALYNTDLALKTTSIDQHTLSVMLIEEIFSEYASNFRII